MTSTKPATDWEAIEREYRVGQLSVAEIGRQYGVSHTAINKRAKKDGWVRDLARQVRETVSARLVSEVSGGNARDAVDLAARRGVELVRQHRTTLGRANTIAAKLLDELESGTDDAENIEAEIELETEADRDPRRRERMLRAVSLPGRAATLRELSQSLKNLIPLERQAFSLDEGPAGDEPATKNDVATALRNLTGDQREQLRSIAGALAGRADGAAEGA